MKKRINNCKYCLCDFEYDETTGDAKIKHLCIKGKKLDDEPRTVIESDCEICQEFDSRYIQYPIIVNDIKNKPIDTTESCRCIGQLCEIRPCSDEYKGKSYIGFYLGELPISIYTSFKEDDGVLENNVIKNPAIFVPELKKIIYGNESWWRPIKTMEDFKGISEEDIQNTWYVKLLKRTKK